ncbi:MAG: hypothetical protein IT355_15005 [Gemmatimonadaceae bacterium]|nr:hypothetical protein [Gemmatimonadaceae bacterium]
MPWFPVIPAELAQAESALGIALPIQYRTALLAPGLRQMLQHPVLGAIDPTLHMHDFVRLTAEVRRDVPEFPADGVVATVPMGRYFRFWLPDPRNPSRLADVIYSWDTVAHRKVKDCTTDAWVRLSAQIVRESDPQFFVRSGAVVRERPAPEPAVRFRAGDVALAALLAAQGAAAAVEVAGAAGRWLPCARMHVSGRHLVPRDLGQLPDGTGDPAVTVVPGEYDALVQVALSPAGDAVVVSALRLVRAGVTDLVAEPHSVLDVDLAAVAVFDRQAFFRRVPVEAQDAVADALCAPPSMPCVAVAGRSAEVLLVPAGAGDGSYPVLVLRREGAVVGLEVRFTGRG